MAQNKYTVRKLMLINLLGGSCVNCGSTDNLEFDHVIPEDKSFSISGSRVFLKLERVLSELQKCQLLCSSCHWDKTRSDFGYGFVEHGKPSKYTNESCRCKLCTTSWAKYIKKSRQVKNNLVH